MTTTIPDPGGPSGVFAALERHQPDDTLMSFAFGDHIVRVLTDADDPWFVLSDICRALAIANAGNVATRLRESGAGVRQADIRSGGQSRSVTAIDESGLYEVIIRSDKPDARKFRRWVTADVLPAIRKTGSYSKYPAHPVASSLPSKRELAQWVIEAEDRAERAEARAAKLEPKAEFFDELMDADGCYTMQATANMIRWGRNVMMRELRRAGVLQGNNLPYRRYAHHFKVIPGTRTHPKTGELIPTATTHVLPSGVEFIRKRLANNDALAVAE